MLRFALLVSLGLVLSQVAAEKECCTSQGPGGLPCADTCTTSGMCVKTSSVIKTSSVTKGVDVEVAHRDCEGQGPIGTILASSFPGGCKTIVSKGSGDGCLTADAGGVATTTICCCDGDKCNGGNFQYGSVFATLFMAVLSRFI